MNEPLGNATAPIPEFQGMESAPEGKKCFLLTVGGVVVVGVARKELQGYIAWSPMPKIPPHLKQLILH